MADIGSDTGLSQILAGMRQAIPNLHGLMIASDDGMPLAHDFPEADAQRVAAMGATALGLGKRIAEQSKVGEMGETVVRGDHGYMMIYAAGESAVLVMAGPANANLGLMRIEAQSATGQISQTLGPPIPSGR